MDELDKVLQRIRGQIVDDAKGDVLTVSDDNPNPDKTENNSEGTVKAPAKVPAIK